MMFSASISKTYFCVIFLYTYRVIASSLIAENKCNEYANEFKCTKPPYEINHNKTYIEDTTSVVFPHMALILQKTANGQYQVNCDGALISSRFILTSAYCVDVNFQPEASTILVARLGDHVAEFSVFDGINQVEVPAKKVYINPSYTTSDRRHDIGLVELVQDVKFTQYIRPACLWYGEGSPINDASVTSFTALNRFPYANEPNALRVFHTHIITNEQCRAKGTYVGVTQMCTVYGAGLNNTHCLEYSGAPLQLTLPYNSCMSQIIGVASHATAICSSIPAVFARVSSYLDWIENIVWNEK